MTDQATVLGSTLVDREKDHEPFTVMGYQASSGKVSDITVRFCGREGYLLLMEESLKMLRGGMDLEALQEELGEDVPAAVSEIKAALESRLNPTDAKAKPHRPIDGKKICDDLHQREDGYTITRLEVLDEVVHEAPPERVSKNPLVATRAVINSRLPLASFLFRMDLTEGKFNHVKF